MKLHRNDPYPFPKQALVFTWLQQKPFENTAGKGEIARNEHFTISHNIFYPFGEISVIFIEFENVTCKSFLLEEQEFVVWERVK